MVFALLFAGVSMPSMVKMFFSGNAEADVVQEGTRGWKLAAVFALVMGSIGTLIGLVIMLKNMDDPAAIGPGVAIANLRQSTRSSRPLPSACRSTRAWRGAGSSHVLILDGVYMDGG